MSNSSSPSLNSLSPIAHLHETCILRDNLLATFLPPLSHDKILASWKVWSEQVVAGNRVIVLQLDHEGTLAGVVSLGFPDTETGKHRSEVGRLLVSHEFRKRGIARRMMEALEGVARERERWMMVSLYFICGCVTCDYARSTNKFTAS